MQKPSDFDGILVQQFEWWMSINANEENVIDKQHMIISGTAYALNPDEVQYLNLTLAQREIEKKLKLWSCDFQELYEERHARTVNFLKSSFGERPTRIKDIITQKRLRMVCLINSPGGDKDREERFWVLAEYIKKSNWDIITFWSHEIKSAAALCWIRWCSREQRFCLDTTQLLFHLWSRCYDDTHRLSREEQEEETRVEWQQLQEILLSNTHADYHPIIQMKIKKAEKNSHAKADRPVIFLWNEVGSDGVGTNLRNTWGLQHVFREVTWIKRITGDIKWFFERSAASWRQKKAETNELFIRQFLQD